MMKRLAAAGFTSMIQETNATKSRAAPVSNFKPEVWEEKFKMLQEFKAKHGHCRVSKKKDDPNGNVLHYWWSRQRQRYKSLVAGDYNDPNLPKQMQMLKDLGVDLEPRAENWDKYFELLKEHKENHGTTAVPRSSSELHNSFIDVSVI